MASSIVLKVLSKVPECRKAAACLREKTYVRKASFGWGLQSCWPQVNVSEPTMYIKPSVFNQKYTLNKVTDPSVNENIVTRGFLGTSLCASPRSGSSVLAGLCSW